MITGLRCASKPDLETFPAEAFRCLAGSVSPGIETAYRTNGRKPFVQENFRSKGLPPDTDFLCYDSVDERL